jgi:mono/diheme cytochrome c family protein
MRRLSTALTTGFALFYVALIGLTLTAQDVGGNAEARKMKNPVPASAESIAAGQALFQRNCRFCHGADAKGNGPQAPKDTHPPDLTDAKWDRGSSDGEIFAVIQNGAGPKFDMKGYKGKISDTDTWNIVNFLRSLGPKNAK